MLLSLYMQRNLINKFSGMMQFVTSHGEAAVTTRLLSIKNHRRLSVVDI